MYLQERETKEYASSHFITKLLKFLSNMLYAGIDKKIRHAVIYFFIYYHMFSICDDKFLQPSTVSIIYELPGNLLTVKVGKNKVSTCPFRK